MLESKRAQTSQKLNKSNHDSFFLTRDIFKVAQKVANN